MSHSEKALKKIIFIDIVLFITLAVLSYFNSYFPLDLRITQGFQSIHNGFFDSLMKDLSFWGEAAHSLTAVLVLSFIFYLFKMKKDAVISVISSYGLVLLTIVVKFLVHRTRPSPSLVEQLVPRLNSGSFPSYHVIISIAIFGYLFLIIRKYIKNNFERKVVEVLLLLIIFLMGASRIYLGAHWASDVLGSLLLGFAWLGVLAKYYEKIPI